LRSTPRRSVIRLRHTRLPTEAGESGGVSAPELAAKPKH
jgi:hypothetical protein